MVNRGPPSGSRFIFCLVCLASIIGIVAPTPSTAGGAARVFVV